jgi:pyruvate ferredoxin oxidoreductase delta subunit
MNKPQITAYAEPRNSNEMIQGATAPIGLLTEKNEGWRNKRPVIDQNKCIHCLLCFVVCPDGVIDKSEGPLTIDYRFCKGCGICANECKVNAISMIKEVG